MFGEFETKNSMSVDEIEPHNDDAPINHIKREDELENLSMPLRDRVAQHIAKTDAVLKSQQRHEPDLSFEERATLSLELLEANPGQFLYRFGKYLLRDHLQYFYTFLHDPEVDYYLKELQKSMNIHTSRIQKRNRRYGALQSLKKSSSYFSEAEMKSREPLLYEQLIGKNLTDEERLNQSLSSIPSNSSFSELLLHHLDKEEEEVRRSALREREEDAFQEEEEEDEEGEMRAHAPEGEGNVVEMDEQIATGRDKVMLREEFYSAMYCNFVTGCDKDFDYSKVDGSDEYDLLDMRSRDEEERYFNEDDDDNEEEFTLSALTLEADPKVTFTKEVT